MEISKILNLIIICNIYMIHREKCSFLQLRGRTLTTTMVAKDSLLLTIKPLFPLVAFTVGFVPWKVNQLLYSFAQLITSITTTIIKNKTQGGKAQDLLSN